MKRFSKFDLRIPFGTFVKCLVQMKSRFCEKFTYHESYSFHRSLSPHQINCNFNFSVEFWQPYISLARLPENTSTMLCGPLLGLLIELSNKIDCNLTYIPDLGTLPIKDLHLILVPITSVDAFGDDIEPFIKLSHILGDLPMMSVLAAKAEIDDFTKLDLSNEISFCLFSIFFVLISILTLISSVLFKFSKRQTILDILRTIFHQTVSKLQAENRMRPIYLNLLLLTFFFNVFLSNLLLSFYQFSIHWDKIDSISGLIDHGNMKIFVFSNEPSADYFTDDQATFHQQIVDRLEIGDPPNEKLDEWQLSMAERINHGEIALVSDKYYLDYYYNTFKVSHPNLYRSHHDEDTLPYFLPINIKVSDEWNRAIDQMIVRLLEHGVYTYWVYETLYLNRLILVPNLDNIDDGGIEELEEEEHDFKANHSPELAASPISMKQLRFIFSILIFSSLIALFCLVFETIYYIKK